MRLIHLSDLHLGLILNGFSMTDDQQYILEQIVQIIDEQDADGVIIAGDIYDKSNPPAEAVSMFSRFLAKISGMKKNIYMISGNHDSAERINYGKEVFSNSGVYISDLYDGHIEPIADEDEFGTINIYLLPFIKPSHVRRVFPDSKIENSNDALRTAVEAMNVDQSVRNVIVTHQFVAGASTCGSDCQMSQIIGTTENVDADIFSVFDYTALGHLHRPQDVIKDRIRYCGTPLKYSFNEAEHQKSVTVVDLGPKGNVKVTTVPLKPLHDLVQISGDFETVFTPASYPHISADDYIEVILNEECDIPDALPRLRSVYPNIMKLSYRNSRNAADNAIIASDADETKSPLELFEDFYEKMNGSPISDTQRELMNEFIKQIWSDYETR